MAALALFISACWLFALGHWAAGILTIAVLVLVLLAAMVQP